MNKLGAVKHVQVQIGNVTVKKDESKLEVCSSNYYCRVTMIDSANQKKFNAMWNVPSQRGRNFVFIMKMEYDNITTQIFLPNWLRYFLFLQTRNRLASPLHSYLLEAGHKTRQDNHTTEQKQSSNQRDRLDKRVELVRWFISSDKLKTNKNVAP